MVLTVLYPAANAELREPLQVDIVAVHGLNGDPEKTWTSPKSNAFWLKDFLPLDVPNARVMTFGYNADAAFGNSAADILDHAKDLLSSLIDRREGADEINRPIIFISHSLGGIVVKQVSCDPLEFAGRSRDAMQALVWADREPRYKTLNEHTAGVLFCGTPHRGSDKAAYGRVLVNVATSVMRRPTSRLIGALRMNSDQLTQLTSQFESQSPRYQVVSFYECKPMKLFSSLVVEKHSALLGLDGEDQIPVDADHKGICRFGSRNDEVYEKLFKRIRRMLKPHVEGQSGSYQAFNRHYLVIHSVSPVFTGRSDVMKMLEENCLPTRTADISKGQKRCVLYGLGGSGKTQVCLKFAQSHRERFWGIFWVDASSSETAERNFLEIARACGVEEDLLVVKKYLSNITFPWLLIVDNADDPSMDISKYFPAGNRGVILVTTRNRGHKFHSKISSEFGEMRQEEAISLLLRCIDEGDVSREAPRALAARVVQLLGCLALAIVQASAFIRQKLCSLEEYCDLYSRRRKQLLGSRPVQGREDYNYTVYTTWEVSLDAIRKMSNETSENVLVSSETAKTALELLDCFSFFHFENIPEVIFKEAWKGIQRGEDSEWLMSQQLRVLRNSNSREWDPYLIREAMMLLSSFSLISTEVAMSNISMHPLVHTWVRDRLEKLEQDKWWLVSASTLAMCISLKYEASDYQLRRTLLPHVDSCYRDGRLLESCDQKELSSLFLRFALVYFECGRYLEASGLWNMVVETQQRRLGDEHPDTLASMSNLAFGYRALGRVQDSVELDERVLEARKRTQGDEHPDTLTSMNNLAFGYRELGRVQNSVELDERVLEARKRTLGDEHPDTLTSMNNLASGYRELGRVQDSVELDERVLEARKRTLEDEHTDTLASMSNLASGYRELGRVQESVELDERVVEARKRTQGDEHPDTLASMSNLASGYSALGRVQDSVELDERVLEARKRTQGDEHPGTLTSMNNLALGYRALGRVQDSVELDERVLEARKRTQGDEHPDTLASMNNLALGYSALGRVQDSVELDERVLEARKRTQGDEHPDTLASVSNLASGYSALGRVQDSVELDERVLEARKRTQGDEHPSTLTSMNNLASGYATLGRRRDALQLLERAVEGSRRVLGEEYPETLLFVENLETFLEGLPRRQLLTSTQSSSASRDRWKLRNWFKDNRRSLE